MTVFRHAESRCPACRYKMDASTAVDGDVGPQPDDVGICFRCTEFLKYDQDLKLVRLPVAEFDQLPYQTKIDLLRTRSNIITARQMLSTN